MEERLHKLVNGRKIYLSDEEEQQLKDRWAKVVSDKELYRATLFYKDQRSKAYPPIGDQLDALYAYFKRVSSVEGAIPPELLGWIESIDAVKLQYPKPEERV